MMMRPAGTIPTFRFYYYPLLMVQTPALGSISDDRLIQVLGTEIAAVDLGQLQAQMQLLAIEPGTSFWQSSQSPPGLYIIIAGKVRLFDRQGERVLTLTVGQSFGESTLFPDADFQPYTAKAALVVGGVEILVGKIAREDLQAIWRKYPASQHHLSQQAQLLDAILRGEAVAPAPKSLSRSLSERESPPDPTPSCGSTCRNRSSEQSAATEGIETAIPSGLFSHPQPANRAMVAESHP
jgi:Cyclic nucleotide-binding domain